MYCIVFRLADDTIERDFLDELPTAKEIREMENDYCIYVKVSNRAYYDDTERKPAKVINLFKIGEDE
jgi:hypothetical protein